MPREVRDHQLQSLTVQSGESVRFEVRTLVPFLTGDEVRIDEALWTVERVHPATAGLSVFEARAVESAPAQPGPAQHPPRAS